MPARTGRIPIVDVAPVIDCGRWPAKSVVGESFLVSATVFREGHDLLGANVVLRGPAAPRARGRRCACWRRAPTAGAPRSSPTTEGDWTFHVEAWSDPMGTWLHAAEIKIPAGLDVELDGRGGRAAVRAARPARRQGRRARPARRRGQGAARRDPAGDGAARRGDRRRRDRGAGAQARYATWSPGRTSYPLRVERERALYGSWYEFFPRSDGAVIEAPDGSWQSGTFRTAP